MEGGTSWKAGGGCDSTPFIRVPLALALGKEGEKEGGCPPGPTSHPSCQVCCPSRPSRSRGLGHGEKARLHKPAAALGGGSLTSLSLPLSTPSTRSSQPHPTHTHPHPIGQAMTHLPELGDPGGPGDQADLMGLESLHCPGNEPPSKVSRTLSLSLPLDTPAGEGTLGHRGWWLLEVRTAGFKSQFSSGLTDTPTYHLPKKTVFICRVSPFCPAPRGRDRACSAQHLPHG